MLRLSSSWTPYFVILLLHFSALPSWLLPGDKGALAFLGAGRRLLLQPHQSDRVLEYVEFASWLTLPIL